MGKIITGFGMFLVGSLLTFALVDICNGVWDGTTGLNLGMAWATFLTVLFDAIYVEG